MPAAPLCRPSFRYRLLPEKSYSGRRVELSMPRIPRTLDQRLSCESASFERARMYWGLRPKVRAKPSFIQRIIGTYVWSEGAIHQGAPWR